MTVGQAQGYPALAFVLARPLSALLVLPLPLRPLLRPRPRLPPQTPLLLRTPLRFLLTLPRLPLLALCLSYLFLRPRLRSPHHPP